MFLMVWNWFLTSRVGQAVAAFSAAILAYLTLRAKHRSEGRAEAEQRVLEANYNQAMEAANARRDAEVSVDRVASPVDELRNRWGRSDGQP